MNTMFFRYGDDVWVTDKCCVVRDPGQGAAFGVEVATPPNFHAMLAEGRKGTLCVPTHRGPMPMVGQAPEYVWLGDVKLARGYWFAVTALYGNKVEWLTSGSNNFVAAVVNDAVVALVMPVRQDQPEHLH